MVLVDVRNADRVCLGTGKLGPLQMISGDHEVNDVIVINQAYQSIKSGYVQISHSNHTMIWNVRCLGLKRA